MDYHAAVNRILARNPRCRRALFGLNSGAVLATVLGVLVKLLLVLPVSATCDSFTHSHDGTCCPTGAVLAAGSDQEDTT